MKVELLHSTPLWVCAKAIRKCWSSEDKSDTELSLWSDGIIRGECGTKDKELIERVGNKNKHSSMLEFAQYVFDIQGISLSCSHQLVRHRTFTFAQQSSRYTLKKILKDVDKFDTSNIGDYCILTNSDMINTALIDQMNLLLDTSRDAPYSNDDLKYLMPTAFKTQIAVRCDGRNLQNFLKLRTDSHSHWEIRQLGEAIYQAIPNDHKFLFEEFVNENN